MSKTDQCYTFMHFGKYEYFQTAMDYFRLPYILPSHFFLVSLKLAVFVK